jgi:hypothetical protein
MQRHGFLHGEQAFDLPSIAPTPVLSVSPSPALETASAAPLLLIKPRDPATLEPSAVYDYQEIYRHLLQGQPVPPNLYEYLSASVGFEPRRVRTLLTVDPATRLSTLNENASATVSNSRELASAFSIPRIAPWYVRPGAEDAPDAKKSNVSSS